MKNIFFLFRRFFFSILFFSFPFTTFAVADNNCIPEKVDFEIAIGSETDATGLLDYITIVYEFIVGSIGIIAVVVIMYWGFRWVTAVGNQTIIGNAKEGIQSALVGVVIALLSYSILFFINASYVSFTDICPSGLSFGIYQAGWETCTVKTGVKSTECSTHAYCKNTEGCSCEKVLDGTNFFCLPLANGTAVAGEPCRNDSNCKSPLQCVNGSNAQAGACESLNFDAPCSQNPNICDAPLVCTDIWNDQKTCLATTGRSDGQYCEEDFQCSSLNCSDSRNVCIAGGAGASCISVTVSDAECSWGFECSSGQCQTKVAESACDEENGCPDGLYCVMNDFEVTPGGSCFDGTANQYCDDSSDCSAAAPVCVDTTGPGSTCQVGDTNSECNGNSECSSSAPYCVDTEGLGSTCQTGADSSPCDDGSDCLSGICYDQSMGEASFWENDSICIEYGAEGTPCTDDTSCSADAPYCVKGTCYNGSEGDSCVDVGDCTTNSCGSGRIGNEYKNDVCINL